MNGSRGAPAAAGPVMVIGRAGPAAAGAAAAGAAAVGGAAAAPLPPLPPRPPRAAVVATAGGGGGDGGGGGGGVRGAGAAGDGSARRSGRPSRRILSILASTSAGFGGEATAKERSAGARRADITSSYPSSSRPEGRPNEASYPSVSWRDASETRVSTYLSIEGVCPEVIPVRHFDSSY